MAEQLYLVIDNPRTGFCELNNVGVFLADSEESACEKARKEWGTAGRYLEATPFDQLHDGWSVYSRG
ncbi:hypothetical protein ABMA58_00020 [Oceanospirillum sp. HFRX-1_2]